MNTEQTLSKHEDFRSYLQRELISRVDKNPAYSLRSFARALGLHHAALSQILNKKRRVTPALIQKLSSKLGLAPEQVQLFLSQAGGSAHSAKASSMANYDQIALDSFHVIADWYHFAILELMCTRGFKSDTKWMAKRLGISVMEVSSALERLERLEMIEVQNGKFKDITGGFTDATHSDFTDAAKKKLQKQILEKSMHALENMEISKRSHSSLVMAIDSNRLSEAKNKIKEFRRQLRDFIGGTTERDQVYVLNIGLFPLTENINGDENESV